MAFALSKILWAVVSPGTLLAVSLAAGLILTTVPCKATQKTGRVLSVFAAFCFLLIALLPVGEWALQPLENRMSLNLPEQVTGIIVLSGDEQAAISEARDTPTALDSLRRYLVFANLARHYPDAKLVYTGGSPFLRPQARLSEAAVARDILNELNVPTDHMIFEKNARNTYENAVFSADIVRPDPSQKWVLVTSPWHMPRAIGCFRKAGWNVFPAPAGYYTIGSAPHHFPYRFDEEMHDLTIAFHEYIGLAAYWLMGKTSALWPE